MISSQKKIIFLDRDGVINKEVSYLFRREDFIFMENIFKSCRFFQNLGYEIIVVTNQSGIYRGYYQEADFKNLTKWMLRVFSNNGVNILDVFHCPHGPKSKCKCRKPKPGMFIEAYNKFDIDMDNSWMIGDKETDIKAANSAGIKKTILVRSGHAINEKKTNATFVLDSIADTVQVIDRQIINNL